MRMLRRKVKVCDVHGRKHWPVRYGLVSKPPKGVLLGGCVLQPGAPRSACPECWKARG